MGKMTGILSNKDVEVIVPGRCKKGGPKAAPVA
jgi:hypothetical protein